MSQGDTQGGLSALPATQNLTRPDWAGEVVTGLEGAPGARPRVPLLWKMVGLVKIERGPCLCLQLLKAGWAGIAVCVFGAGWRVLGWESVRQVGSSALYMKLTSPPLDR